MAAAERRRLGLLLTTALILAGCALRLGNFFDALEYDEIWTLERYVAAPVSAIFSDLAIPNNHPLHSCLIKGVFAFFEPSIPTLRLPALLAECAALLAGAALVWLFYLPPFEALARNAKRKRGNERAQGPARGEKGRQSGARRLLRKNGRGAKRRTKRCR